MEYVLFSCVRQRCLVNEDNLYFQPALIPEGCMGVLTEWEAPTIWTLLETSPKVFGQDF